MWNIERFLRNFIRLRLMDQSHFQIVQLPEKNLTLI